MTRKFKWLPKRHFTDLTLLTLRLLSGGLMLTHGIPKFERLLEGNVKFADPLGLGEEFTLLFTVLAEVICAGFLVLGIVTRAAVIPLIIVMLGAIFVIHIHDPFGQKEMAIFYLVLYLLIYFKGPGKLSLDYLIFKKGK